MIEFFKRPGRLDRIFVIPTIEEADIAYTMLKKYMADQWQDDHKEVVDQLVDQPGAFVREVALHARMLAAHEHKTVVTLEMLKASVSSLAQQLRLDGDFLLQRKPMGLGTDNSTRRSTSRRGLGDF